MKRHMLLVVALAVVMSASKLAAEDRPNIVLIMVDDMGFSDLHCYGGEIDTPNLDRLAASGLRFSQFYNCAKCETTRATLMSGRYYHEVGVGKLTRCVTIAEALKQAGYTTLMTGKWHLSGNPVERGFDRYFGHLSGACNFFRGDNTFRLDDQPFQVPAEGFYTTDANTDYAIQFLNEREPNKPFFLYIAYNAPHYPLHAPKREVEKYRGKYLIGWDELRRQRYSRMAKLGILAKNWEMAPRPDDVPAWDSLSEEEKDIQDLMMAAYAGMIDRVDQNIGRLVEHLASSGVMENTLFLFLSDNGACPFQRTTQVTRSERLMPWDPKSYWTYDKGWAHACNTPFREYKRNQHEGGISTPLIAHWPDHIADPGSITHQPGHLVDIMATCLDVAGASYPTRFRGEPVGPPRGLSLRPIFSGRQRSGHEYIFFSFYGTHNALRVGNWKLVNINSGPWELYDLAADRTELHDLAQEQPQRYQQMQQRWSDVVRQLGDPARKKSSKDKSKKK